MVFIVTAFITGTKVHDSSQEINIAGMEIAYVSSNNGWGAGLVSDLLAPRVPSTVNTECYHFMALGDSVTVKFTCS